MDQFIDGFLTLMFFVCSVVVFLNVIALWRDRAIKGVSIWPVVMFLIVDGLQTVRFFNEDSYGLAAGAFIMLIASAVWLGLAAFFAFKRVSFPNISED